MGEMDEKKLLMIVLAAFVILSALGLTRPEGKNHEKGPLAAELAVETTVSGDLEYRTYVNSAGAPVAPSDRGYATLL